MPIDLNEYPDGWREITYQLKEFVGWRCEWCDATHGSTQLNCEGEPYTMILTCAHLNHDVENPEAPLVVLCPACHLDYDRPLHLLHAMETLYMKRRQAVKDAVAAGQQVLFTEALPA